MKDDSISFSFEASMKGQALGDLLKFKESDKIKNDCSGILGKRVTK